MKGKTLLVIFTIKQIPSVTLQKSFFKTPRNESFQSFEIHIFQHILNITVPWSGDRTSWLEKCKHLQHHLYKKVNKQVYPKSTGKLEKRREICWNMQFFIKLRGKTLLAIFLIKKIASLTFERVIFQNTSKWRLSIFENSHISTYGTLIRRLNFLAEKMQTHAT